MLCPTEERKVSRLDYHELDFKSKAIEPTRQRAIPSDVTDAKLLCAAMTCPAVTFSCHHSRASTELEEGYRSH